MTEPEDESTEHPKAFISYAQGHPDWDVERVEEWKTTVLRFAALLCEMGIDAEVDQFHAHDADVDWNRFGPRQIQDSEHVLLAFGGAYRDRWEARNAPTVGAGAVREADELLGLHNVDQVEFRRRVKIVLLPGATTEDVPPQLLGLPHFRIEELSERGVEDLYRTLTKQPATPKPALGRIRRMPPRPLTPTQESAVAAAEASHDEISQLRLDLARIQGGLADVPADVRAQAERGSFALPWVRVARQLINEEQAILARLAELGREETRAGQDTLGAAGDRRLERLLAEAFEAAGAPAEQDVIREVSRRLADPHIDVDGIAGLFENLPGLSPRIEVQKRVKYELHRAGVIARNPHGRGWIRGDVLRPEA